MKLKSNALNQAIKFALATTTTAGLFISGSAVAAEESETKVNKNVEKIAVVGTRSAPRSIGDSPVPIDIIGGEELEKSGNTDMLELLKGSVPSFNVHQNPISDAASLVRPANLRGLPSDSTLILLNGKRRHRASVIAFLGGGINDGAQGADISVIPSIALKQVEVLRDGAAAQYGSDAIAGVMNFQLKDASEGGKFEVRHGQYYEGDGDTTQISGNVGLPFTDNGFANLSFQYKTADATSRSEQRPDAAALSAAGVPEVSSLAQVWGAPEVDDDISIFGNFGLELTNDSEFYMFGNYSERDVRGGFYYRNPHTRPGVYSNDGGETLLVADLTEDMSGNCPTIAIDDNVLDNPDYISGVANNPDCFAFNETIPGGFTPNFGGNITDTSLTIGTKGMFTGGFLKDAFYDLSGTVGLNESRYFIYDTVNASLGADSPRDFSPGKYEQLEKNFNFDLSKGFDFDLAYDVNIAGGLEWHEETFTVISGDEASFTAGPLTEQGFGIGSNGFPGFKPSDAGEYTRRNYAAYVDIEAPFTEEFLMGLAVRFEDYDSFGTTTNYKVMAQYHVTEDLNIRGSVSTGFRAPTVGQANVSNVQTNLSDGVLQDSALLPPTNPIAVQLGGTELEPEESQSYTLGAVYTIGDLFVTLDYYNIEVDDRISQSEKIVLSQDDKDTLEAAGVPNAQSYAQVSFFTNDFDTTTQGIDLVANYTADMLGGSSTFSLAYNWNETEVTKFSDITGEFKVKRLEEDLPNHRATLTWAQQWESFSMFTRANYYGEYQGVHVDYDATAKTADAAVTIDAEITYFLNESISFSVGAQNIFDQDAEKLDFEDRTGIPNNNWGGQYYETSPYGINGGFYYAKATYTF
ncbi:MULTISPECIES: TonB-dependent siderophore receptor [Pseudoalteromonas]|jgi:iron complex outermembrane receptor protein|uniref:Ligand-gated channel n=1 Tax=Pseudoalteromonas atlantica TaxID=288 RepID=A0ABQ0UEL5_PSEAF|nr:MULTISPECIES: TonB-dependent receptor [Pseudoalteromonas]MAJ39358.1 TonB-dependent receptor [Pseudoalteromonadaceae bacterium]MCP4060734.1 TonB-dependent receptor [Pseudoalteromonas sp.]OUX90768.1 MAG: TonB-dependent receptor [Pseudoalteromonas sp. TMED43]GEK76895.1 ligand-gated channel [Pseudoalteromonas atlantica]ENN97834.1 putative TonB-dependent outer membrane receptor [Pseudoalteromonas agarivorans S816]|tara:strand:+ start:351 stop:2930 length:2580 start_codon:yes stop_codon:yes gene_type:complete